MKEIDNFLEKVRKRADKKGKYIRYDDQRKDLPCAQLYYLFKTAGWADGTETNEMRNYFESCLKYRDFLQNVQILRYIVFYPLHHRPLMWKTIHLLLMHLR